MKCPRCQHESAADAVFCQECGTRLEVACPGCGTVNQPGAKFCKKCGQPIATTPPAETAAKVPAPGSYTPKHLAEKILTSRRALEGERKQVTVLFADLKGSMELLADRDPEEARNLLDAVLEHMMEAVHRYEGTVNQVMGDGIMALFGAPIAHEDHAVRACYAALRMQEAVKRYAERMRREEGVTIRIRVGLNSGDVVVRAIGSDLNMDYTAVGQTTHLAARMEQIAEPGTVLLPLATLALCEDFVQVKELGRLRVRGLTEPVEAYELIGANPVRSRFQAHAARGLTKFVGRASELVQLVEALDLARGGRGQVVAVVGEPGVGKSRLVWEFAHSYRTDGSLVLQAASVAYGKATTYLPVIELLHGYFQIETTDDVQKIREKVTGKVFSLDRALESALAPLLALLDVPVDDHEWTRLDPPQRRQRTLDAMKRLLLREGRVQPLVVIFEDLHWIDSETQAVLEGLVESLPTARVLLLVSYRPEYQHAWGRKTYYRQLQIDALSDASAGELLGTLLGADSSLDELKRVLISGTEGNPFFLEESVRTLIETSALAGAAGAYRLTKAPGSLQMPATVQAVLAARIDRLAPEDKRLLQAASVIGKDAPFALLQAVAEEPEEHLRRGLANLQAAEFLYEARLFPDLEYTFKHALTHDVAYRSVLQERRRTLHRQIMETIERLHPDRLAEHIEQLAHHAFHGQHWEKAVLWQRQAGNKAATRSAYLEALSNYDQAFAALNHLPESREKLEQQIDLHLDSRNALFWLGDHSRVGEHLHAAEALAQNLGDRDRTVRVLNFLNSYHGLSGDPELAIRFGQRALALISESDAPQLSVITDYYLGAAYNKLGQYSHAINVLKRAIGKLVGELRLERLGIAGYPAVACRGHLIQCLTAIGQFREGISYAEEGIQIAEELGDLSVLVYVNCSLAVLFLVRGDFAKAIEILERTQRICQSANVPVYVPYVASRLGAAYANSGRISEAISYLEQGVENSAAAGRIAFLSLSTAWLSEGYLLCERFEEASCIARRALDLSKEHKERGHEAWVLKLIGDIALHRAPLKIEEAEEHYRQALALSREMGMRPLQAHCHFGLGRVSLARGSLDEARTEISAASDLYDSMEMELWRSRADAALRNLAM